MHDSGNLSGSACLSATRLRTNGGQRKLRDSLDRYGVSCFVAHEDIEPTKEWQDEIEGALFSMDALVALLTERFSESCWTDQEIGIAYGRGVPVVPVRLGTDPYGFIGKYQALAGGTARRHGRWLERSTAFFARSLYSKNGSRRASSHRFESATSFAHAKELMNFVGDLKQLRPDLIDRLERAPKENPQVGRAYKVPDNLAGIVRRLRGASQDSAANVG